MTICSNCEKNILVRGRTCVFCGTPFTITQRIVKRLEIIWYSTKNNLRENRYHANFTILWIGVILIFLSLMELGANTLVAGMFLTGLAFTQFAMGWKRP